MNPTHRSSSPPTSLDSLSTEQLALLTEWVDAGIQSHTALTDQQKKNGPLFQIRSTQLSLPLM